ncbi:FAD/NAD(P)-binding domain-containing protein [Nemania sp. FL0031]|nr:FAD/NAD(P)-binding domain-containing protein [Nemania sp. FL0031]
MSKSTIRVAICGGGLAGSLLFHALAKYAHIDAHIFESAATFRGEGLAIGLARNALSALDLIGPSATRCLEQAGAAPLRGVRFMLAEGEQKGSMIDEDDGEAHGKRVTSIVHRAALLEQLLADVPSDRMHHSKKLDRIEKKGGQAGPITLYFTDGSTHECDILVGADGIHSTVRKIIDPNAGPQNTGWWAVMVLKPFAEAEVTLREGPRDINAREYMWVGDGAFALHNVLDNGERLQLIIASKNQAAESSDSWQQEVGADALRKICESWPDHLRNTVDKLICDQPTQRALYLWDHLPAKSYVSGPICVIGDAAHATTPWQGSGGGMSVEDCLILSALLGRAKGLDEALVALSVYDEVRRPRTQSIVESSRVTGTILAGQGEETGLDLEKLRQKLLPRWSFIIDFDNEAHLKKALEILEQKLEH